MPQMTTTGIAVDFYPVHPVGKVIPGANRSGYGGVKTRPAGAAIKLRVRRKQQRAAASAVVIPRCVVFIQGATARTFRAVLAQDAKLLRAKTGLPFGLSARQITRDRRWGHRMQNGNHKFRLPLI